MSPIGMILAGVSLLGGSLLFEAARKEEPGPTPGAQALSVCHTIGAYAATVAIQRNMGVPEARAGRVETESIAEYPLMSSIIHLLYHEGRALTPENAEKLYFALCDNTPIGHRRVSRP